jgi:hypothetical protein
MTVTVINYLRNFIEMLTDIINLFFDRRGIRTHIVFRSLIEIEN